MTRVFGPNDGSGTTLSPRANADRRELDRRDRDALFGSGVLDGFDGQRFAGGTDVARGDQRISLPAPASPSAPAAPVQPPPSAREQTTPPAQAQQVTATQAEQTEAGAARAQATEVTNADQFRTGNSVVDQTLSRQTFVQNPLNNFHLPTYKFRFFVTNDDWLRNVGDGSGPSSQRALNNSAQVTIAESGVTNGYVIKDVTIKSNVGPNGQSRNIMNTDITMEVHEPLGTSFIDAMAGAARDLGVRNYARSFYFLELSFLGYNEDGVPVANIVDEFPNGGRWLYVVKILDINTTFTSSGGVYTVRMQPYEQTVFTNENLMRVPQFLSVSGNTVAEFTRSLKEAINRGYRNRYGESNPQFFEIEDFVVSYQVEHRAYQGTVGEIKLVNTEQWRSPRRNLRMTSSATETPTAQIPLGTPISDIIEWMFANSEQAQRLGIDGGRQSGQTDAQRGQSPNETGVRETVVFRIEPEVQVTGFDPVTNQYKLKARYHIKPYLTQRPILTQAQVVAARRDDVQRAMRTSLERRNLIRKRYDWLFTGNNTEVIECDIKFNLNWTAVQPSMVGGQGRYDATAVGALSNNFTREQQGNREQADPTVEEQAAQVTNEIGTTRSQTTAAQQGLDRILREQEDLRRQAAQASGDRRRDLERRANALNADIADLESGLTSNNLRLGSLNRRLDELTSQITVPRTLQDAQGGRAADRAFAEDTIARANIGEVPVAFEQNRLSAANALGVGFEGQYHIDKSVFGAVLDQLYNQVSGYLARVELTIRGDPYWLGPGNVQRLSILRSAGRSPDGLPDFFAGDQHFLLVMRYPYTIGNEGANEGRPVIREQDQFNGLYSVVTVENTFTEGVFRQKLSANRLPLFSYLKAYGSNVANGNRVA